jgi:type I restriction enzyme R subunit
MGLLDLIVKSGIANAISTQLGALKGNKNAIAETIENNVRRKIIKEQLTDPAYYEKMSALLDEIIAARKAKAIEYEDYLKRIADLARKVEAGLADDTPEPLKRSRALRAIYNNLPAVPAAANAAAEPSAKYDAGGDEKLKLALRIDEAVKRVRPDGWRGVQPREQVIKAELYRILRDEAEVERIFLVVRSQAEY